MYCTATIATVSFSGSCLSYNKSAACNGCHLAPESGAPQFDLADYATTLDRAELVVTRVAGGTMPPPGAEPELELEQRQLIDRWFATGFAP